MDSSGDAYNLSAGRGTLRMRAAQMDIQLKIGTTYFPRDYEIHVNTLPVIKNRVQVLEIFWNDIALLSSYLRYFCSVN